jgi:hypothetical protein
MGFTTFIPKYLQSYFGLTPASASIYTGLVAALSWSLGPIIGGPLLSRMKVTVSKSLLFVVVIHIIAVVGYTIAFFLSCPEARWAGFVNGMSYSMPCNSNCSCDPTSYTPVCGSDGSNYFSPCYAGCQLEMQSAGNSSEKEFFNCQCLDGSKASLGLCERQCGTFYVYISVIFVTLLVSSMMLVVLMTCVMRCVDEKDKAMALALSTFVMNLAAFPAPLLYGRVIDSACLVQQSSCVHKGACLLYDLDNFRIRFHMMPIITQTCSAFIFGLGWRLSRRRLDKRSPDERCSDEKAVEPSNDREAVL